MEGSLAPHILEINKALNGKLTENEIREELEKLADYKVPLEEAKRLILRKYSASPTRKLSEIKAGDRDIEITGKVLDIKKRTVKIKGAEKTIFQGVLVDETHARSFTAWEDPGIAPGDVVRLSDVYIRNWQDRPEINITRSSQVTKLDPADFQIDTSNLPEKKLAELEDGDINIRLNVTVLEAQKKEINTPEGSREILTGVVADETAKLPFTSWTHHPEIKPGASLQIENAYIRSFRGVPALNISETTRITPTEEEIKYQEKIIPLGDLTRRQGAYDVLVEGNIISIRPGSGLIVRCPECGRVIQKSTCRVHGKVNGTPDMRVKAILDDGTGALTLVMDAKLTQEITGYTLEEVQEMAKTSMSPEVVEEEIRCKLLGTLIRAKGNMSRGDYGATLVASQIEEPVFNTVQMAQELLETIT